MKNSAFSLLAFLFLFTISCKTSEKGIDETRPISVIATIDGEEISIDELKYNYNRNSLSAKTEPDSSELRDFLPSYVEYRLKLREGYRLGFDQDPEIRSEYTQYAREAAYRYWINDEIKSKRIDTFTERFDEERKAFHILKELPEDATPEDTLAVFRELMAVRDSLINGADPETMNENYSSKREGNPVGGNLQWITAGTTIQPFEDALYQLEPGEISLPVRTQFGYHLIILDKVRPRSHHRLVRHIYIAQNEDSSQVEKANRAFEALQRDTAWSEVVQAFSEDRSSVNRDGLIGWVGYGMRYPIEFIEAVMDANPDSAYTPPLQMSYGTQIIRIDSVRTFRDPQQKTEYIINHLERLDRLDPDREDVHGQIATEIGVQVDNDTFSMLTDILTFVPDDPDLLSLVDEENRQQTLVTAFDSTYSVNNFLEWVTLTTESTSEALTPSAYLDNYEEKIIEEHIVEYTRQRFPEFRAEADHLLNGLIVFKVNEEYIWNPETVNRKELKSYYESNMDEYSRGMTFAYKSLADTSESVIRDVHSYLDNGNPVEELESIFSTLSISTDSTYQAEKSAYQILDNLDPGEFSEPVTVDGRNSILILDEIRQPRILTFEEVFDRVFSDYQPIREENFMNRLEERYSVKLYPENIH